MNTYRGSWRNGSRFFISIWNWGQRKHFWFHRLMKKAVMIMQYKHQCTKAIKRRDRYLPIKNRTRGDVGVIV